MGAGLVVRLGARTVAIGRDCRVSSPGFAAALSEGVRSAGGDVIDIGEVPTDAVYFYSGAHEVHGAAITASHNPPEYNGLKLCRPGAAPIGMESGLAEVEAWVIEGSMPEDVPWGEYRQESIVGDYVDHLFRIVDPASITDLRVAADGGNGMAGVAIHQVFDRIAASLTGLYLEPDGTFPNHPADPLVPENLEDLEQLMASDAFDLGVEVGRVRIVVFLVASLLVGSSVAASGSVGYVGLVVPHLARLSLGSDNRISIPAAALGGALFVIVADTVARTIIAPRELPVGAITALIGAPLFIYLLKRA